MPRFALQKHPKRWWWGLPLLIVIIVAWRLLHHESVPAKVPVSVPVTTAVVHPQNLPDSLTGIGTVQATASVTVKVRVDGQLERVNFVEGQDVKAGQVLAQIDPSALQAQLEQAQAQKAKDQAQLANARLDLQRYTALVKQDAVSRQTLDTQRALVAQLAASVKTDQAQIDYAAVQLGYTTIRAPVSGRTGVRLIDPGNIVHATDATGLVVINQIDPITVLFRLPEDDFQRINRAINDNHQPLQVQAYPRNGDGDTPLATGQLLLVDNQIDPTTGTVQLKATFPNPRHNLWPGQYVNARLLLGERSDVIAVATSVIQHGPDGPFIYVVRSDGTAAVQPVRVGVTVGSQTIIEHGLTAGTRVVTDGQYKLSEGAHVTEAAHTADASAQLASPSDPKAPGKPATPTGKQGN